VALAFAGAWVAAGAVGFGLRPDLVSAGVIGPIAAWTLCGAVVLGVVLRPRARGLPVGVRALQHALWTVPAAYVAGAAIVNVPSSDPITWASIRGCLGTTTALTVGPLIAAALFFRGSFLSAPGWRGAAVGALAGLAGSIGIHAHCPKQALWHLLVAHGTAILAGAATGAGLGAIGGRA
jgi:hypothetical protein